MGNYACHGHYPTPSNKLKNMLKSKLKKNASKTEYSDQFFIQHVQNNKKNDNFIDINQLDQRRVVFVSLIGIYQTWRYCPSATLYSALFVLPLKRKWIYNPSEHVNELPANLLSQISIFSDSAEMRSFISLVKWKDSQKLVFWMCDEYQVTDICKNELVDPFWRDLSAKLSKLYDPITRSQYNPIKFAAKWWGDKQEFSSKYNTKTSSILAELYFLTMKFNTIQEILHQSNPKSFCPLKSYPNRSSMTQLFDDDENDTSSYWEYDLDLNDSYL